MAVELRLDLGREDVGAAAQDQVVATIRDVEVAILVEAAEVAERLPATFAFTRVRADVAVGLALGVHEDLADLADGQLPTVGIQDANPSVLAPPDRSAMRQPLVTADCGAGNVLGAGV